MSPSAAGLAISSALMLTGSFQWGVRLKSKTKQHAPKVSYLRKRLWNLDLSWWMEILIVRCSRKVNDIYFHRQATSENVATVRQTHFLIKFSFVIKKANQQYSRTYQASMNPNKRFVMVPFNEKMFFIRVFLDWSNRSSQIILDYISFLG
jgi:hypothetical protein